MSEWQIVVVCLGNVCRSPLEQRLLSLRFSGLLGNGWDHIAVSYVGVSAPLR